MLRKQQINILLKISILSTIPLFMSPDLLGSDPIIFSSSESCGECHQTIFKDWKKSLHAGAISDPIFQSALLQAQNEEGNQIKKLCLSCHSPTTRITGDIALKKEISLEGVTCDFCHRIKAVHLDQKDPFEIDTGKTKYGPFKDADSSAHPVAYSKKHEDSQLCAGCHEFKNKNGVLIFSTYSEWKEGPYAKEGVTCQKCHMPARKGHIASKKFNTPERSIHSHETRGGHSVDQLKEAVSLKIGKVVQHGEKVSVTVKLTNNGSGHKIPTGIPSRKIVLTFRAKSGKTVLFEDKRIYQKIVANKKGVPIDRDDHFFTQGTSILEDNRIGPRETREEHFSFLAPKNQQSIIEATVSYLYEPLILKKTEMRVELMREEKTVEVK